MAQTTREIADAKIEALRKWIAGEHPGPWSMTDCAAAVLAERDALKAYAEVADQALREVRHAHSSGERWYTRGESGLREQVRLWLDKADAARRALNPSQS